MPTIRDVVHALARRDGVDAVIVLGRDGLAIDAKAGDGLDAEGLAALIPPVVAACDKLGGAAARGGFGTGIVEFSAGTALLAELTTEVLLAVFFRPGINVGGILYEIRRHRGAIAGLL